MHDVASSTENAACLLTPPGRGAIAAIAVSGPASVEVLTKFFQPRGTTPVAAIDFRRIVYGAWAHATCSEDAILLRRAEDWFEIHCHGGSIASKSILETLRDNGFRAVSAAEYWLRVQPDPWQSAAVEATCAALTLRAADRLLQNADGRWAMKIRELTPRILTGNDDPGLLRELHELAESYVLAARLICGWRIAIAGRPNVGKSSLINRLVGFDRSLVFDRPGTTRDVVSQWTAIGQWPVQLLDMAGLRGTDDPVESLGVRSAEVAIGSADIAIWVSDLSQAWSDVDAQAAANPDKFLLVHNKSDLAAHADSRPEGIRISVRENYQLDRLLQALEQRLESIAPDPARLLAVRPWQRDALRKTADLIARGDRQAAVQTLQNPPVDSRQITVDESSKSTGTGAAPRPREFPI